MNESIRRFLGIFGCSLVFCAACARADVTLSGVFGDHMVLQREQPVPLWGEAKPGEKITVKFRDQEKTVTADDKGKWMVKLDPMAAGGPDKLVVSGGNTVEIQDVLVGEVWLCSGQSNMAWVVANSLNAQEEIKNADFPAIRAFTSVGAAPAYTNSDPKAVREFSLAPQDRCEGSWQVCTPNTVGRFSAVGYFFARELHQRLKVPVGIVVASFGATAIEAWMSLDGLKAVPCYRERAERFEEAAQAYLADKDGYEKAKARMQATYLERQRAWVAKLDAEDPGLRQKWMAASLDTSAWGKVTLPVSVKDNPIGSPVASIWFRKEVTIPQAWVGKDLELHLGVVDGVDDSFVNGARVGRTWFDSPRYWEISRVYPIAPAATTSEHVTVALRVVKLIYQMGLFGPAGEMKLVLKDLPDAPPVSLAGEWRMQKATDLDAGAQPQPPFAKIPGSYYGDPCVMYNGVLHPLIPYGIRGAIWYQGESNAPFYVDYRDLLPGLITSWRQDWGQGDFPFGIVQLANLGGQQTRPVERGTYADVRDAQAAALRVPNTFLATAIDIGGDDIHPRNKQEVGRRLALGALATAYGQKGLVHAGPMYKSMKVEGGAVRLRFDLGSGMHARGDPLVGFVIAGEDRAFHFASAKIEGETVLVWSDKVPAPVAVRYAWAGNPVCNLYNGDDLPAFPFRTDDWDPAKIVIPEETLSLPAGWKEW